MGLRRGALTILLLPILVLIFVFGWALYWIGEQQNRNRVKTPQKEMIVAKEGTTDENVEVGLIEDLMEKVLKAE